MCCRLECFIVEYKNDINCDVIVYIFIQQYSHGSLAIKKSIYILCTYVYINCAYTCVFGKKTRKTERFQREEERNILKSTDIGASERMRACVRYGNILHSIMFSL